MDPPLIVADLLATAISEKEQRQQTKESAIREAVRCRDRRTLVKLARSKGGLVNDSLRKLAWPFLLGCDADAFQDPDWKVLLPAHPEEAQVRLDTDRAFHFYPESRTPSPATSDDLLRADRDELFDVITHVLRLHPSLSYFQGFHDIAQVLYLVLGRRHAVTVLEHLSLTRLRDFMMPDIEPSVDHLSLIPALLAQIDRPLADVLRYTRPHYALATILTMFAHVVESYSEITLVFDFFFSAADMALPVYLYVVILISRRDELLSFQKNTQADPEKEQEQDEEDIHETAQMLEATISRFPQPLPLALSDALSRALALWMQYPPHTLTPAYDKISKYSVLKTLREPTAAEDMYSGVEQLDGEDEKRMVSRRERIRRRRKRIQESSTSSSPRPSRRPSSASVVEEYDYIELDRVHKPADYTALDALVARQTSECKKRAARERARVERQRAREARERKNRAVRERRSATRRLAEQIPGAVATLYRRGVGAEEGGEESGEGGEGDTLDGSIVLLGKPADMQQATSSSSPTLFTAFRRARPPTAQVNGTATTLGGVRRFKFADARRTITALSPSSMMAAIGMVSFCIGVLSWWVSWFLRRDY
ncbi:rab-GTPase-TBC domain-containing protein [Myxozyma melibiosi]|uniref:Rab-GTPase-TBC domain-containing protein n=1 Tax=Myxozyma melibiosi TaxID=54550 RepID=A0ABR1FAW1_9ASCO